MKRFYLSLLFMMGHSLHSQEGTLFADLSDDYSEEFTTSFTSEQSIQWESLLDAIIHNDSSQIRKLIVSGAPLNAPETDLMKETPVTCAVVHADQPCIEQLLEAGADIDAEDNKGNTALLVAVSLGKTDMVRYLLSRGAHLQPNRTLYEAASEGQNACIQILIDTGANLGKAASIALLVAAQRGHLETIKLLLHMDADLYHTSFYDEKNTCLHEAAKFFRVDCVEYLLQRGIPVNTRNKEQKTPLYLACASFRLDGDDPYETVSLLLKNGANPNDIASDGSTILHTFTNARLLPLLLQNNADIDRKNNLGFSPFHEAILYPRKRELLEQYVKYSYKSVAASKKEHVKRCATFRNLFLIFIHLNIPLYVQMNILDFDKGWSREITEVAFYKLIQDGALKSPLLVHAKERILDLWWTKLNRKILLINDSELVKRIQIPHCLRCEDHDTDNDYMSNLPNEDLLRTWDSKKNFYYKVLMREGIKLLEGK